MMKYILCVFASVLFLSTARAEQTYWTGIKIEIDGNTAKVTVDLDCIVDADEGTIALVVQDEKYKPLEEPADPKKHSTETVKRGRQRVTLSKTVTLTENQKELQIWTPMIPAGQTETHTPVKQFYELKHLDDGTIVAVIATQEE